MSKQIDRPSRNKKLIDYAEKVTPPLTPTTSPRKAPVREGQEAEMPKPKPDPEISADIYTIIDNSIRQRTQEIINDFNVKLQRVEQTQQSIKEELFNKSEQLINTVEARFNQRLEEKEEIGKKFSEMEEKLAKMERLLLRNENEIDTLKSDLEKNKCEKQLLEKKLEENVNETLLLKYKLECEIGLLKNNLAANENQIRLLISEKENNSCEARKKATEIEEKKFKQEEKSLILGDYSLTKIQSRDLSSNCTVRTIADGNLDSLQNWVTEKLDFPVKNCIIYGGLQDIIGEESNTESLLDKLGSLLTALKSRNESVNVKICELIPSSESTKEQISLYNEKIKEWCERNGVMFLQTRLFFTLGTGEIDTNCFNPLKQNLNRTGAIRLLDAISKDSPQLLCEDWIQRKSIRSLPRGNERGHLNTNFVYRQQPQGFGSTRYGGINNSDHYTTPTYAGMVRGEIQRQPVRRDDHRPEGNSLINTQNYQNYYSYNRHSGTKRKSGCFNCGERNHHRHICRYDRGIICNFCHERGHKERHCPHYSD